MYCVAALVSSLVAAAYAQQVGTQTAEVHPSLPIQTCSAGSACTTVDTKITLDANWRWLHSTADSTNCFHNNKWNSTLCPNVTACAANCALDGAEYTGTYRITTGQDSLEMFFVTGPNVGSRVYMMDTDDTNYKLFKLKNREFTFDVDASNLPCGLNGAVYFAQMDADGGSSRFPTNKAGAKYGTGYCDAQCPKSVQFISGEANFGSEGSCCSEIDIWEANRMNTALTPHPCSVTEQTRCSGSDCDNNCDTAGCDFNPYRMGNESFYGTSGLINTGKVITVVTQFITADNTDTGALSEINRFYVQDGKTIPNTMSNIAAVPAENSITDSWCDAQKSAFKDPNNFKDKGGLGTISKTLDAGVVLILSVWADYATNMTWLDSTFPTTSKALGADRGSCATSTGYPPDLVTDFPNASVIYSNIKFGAINSTFSNSS